MSCVLQPDHQVSFGVSLSLSSPIDGFIDAKYIFNDKSLPNASAACTQPTMNNRDGTVSGCVCVRALARFFYEEGRNAKYS